MKKVFLVIFFALIALLISTGGSGQIKRTEFCYSDDRTSFIRLDSLAENGNYECVDELCRAAYYSDGALAEIMPEFLRKGINKFPREYMSYFTMFPDILKHTALLLGFEYSLSGKKSEESYAEILALKEHIVGNLEKDSTLYKTANIFVNKVIVYFEQCLDN